MFGWRKGGKGWLLIIHNERACTGMGIDIRRQNKLFALGEGISGTAASGTLLGSLTVERGHVQVTPRNPWFHCRSEPKKALAQERDPGFRGRLRN